MTKHLPKPIIGRSKMEIKFREFHAENPKVEKTLYRIAMELVRKGYTTYGLPALWEVLRYSLALDVPGMAHKFPNGYKAYYARLLMLKHPKLKGFFRIKEMTANGEPDLSDLV